MSNLSVADWRIWKNAPTEPPTDVIQAAIDASEEAIDDRTGRVFAVAGSATARLFAPVSNMSTVLEIDDCTSVTSVVAYGTTLDASAYQLEPVGARDYAGRTVPYSRIRLLYGYWPQATPGEASVSVTGTWGWASLPKRYTEATKILSADLLEAKDIRNGVIGFSDYAAFRVRDNGQVAALLQRLTRARAGGPV